MTLEIKHWGQHFTLYPHYGAYWKEFDALLIADIHIGKDGHFRKAGIAVPGHITQTDLQVLQLLIDACPAKQVIFMGDLFHSAMNKDCLQLKHLIEKNKNLNFVLIKGNHDIIDEAQILDLGIDKIETELIFNDVRLTHIPLFDKEKKNIAGHYHPAIKMRGKSRMGLKIPAFYFGHQQSILPAFSQFSGHAIIKPEKGEQVFIVIEGEVIAL